MQARTSASTAKAAKSCIATGRCPSDWSTTFSMVMMSSTGCSGSMARTAATIGRVSESGATAVRTTSIDPLKAYCAAGA
jgi:hypothetical protein